jgi:hypothetical protein
MAVPRFNAARWSPSLNGDASGHTKLDDEKSPICKGDGHLLSTTISADDRFAHTERCAKNRVASSCFRCECDHTLAQNADIDQLGTNDPRFERSTKVFDFRQFRHSAQVPTGLNPILATSQRRVFRRSLYERFRFPASRFERPQRRLVSAKSIHSKSIYSESINSKSMVPILVGF